MYILLFLLGLGALAYYFMNPEERAPFIEAAKNGCRTVWAAALERLKRDPAEPRRPRPPLAIATVLITIVNLLVFVEMVLAPGALADSTLVAWGGNFSPRTTNGEWWRLTSATFVHAGPLHLLADLAGLVFVGIILERYIGFIAFATVYLISGVFASLVALSEAPVATSVGSSGAVFGVYGLLVVVWIWTAIRRDPMKVPPLRALKVIGPAIALFVAYNVATDRMGKEAELAGFISGFLCGLALEFGSPERKPAFRRVLATVGSAAVLCIAAAVPLSGITDVRPEISRLIALEDRTSAMYQAAVERFSGGRMQARRLAELIDTKIAPEVRAARARLKALQKVPQEYEPVVAAAEEYLRLRDESWRIRSEALHHSDMRTLQQADRIEWQSRTALEPLRRIG